MVDGYDKRYMVCEAPADPAGMATMVSNHDAFAGQRLHDQVGGNAAQYKLAAATSLLQPGTPFIYYGEEVGMAGAYPHDAGDAAADASGAAALSMGAQSVGVFQVR